MQSLQSMQPGFSAFKQNERLQPQVSMLSGIDGAPLMPDFSINNQFGGNPFTVGSGSANPFGLTAGAAAAAATLPAFGSSGGRSGGGMNGGAGATMAAAAEKFSSSAEKLASALGALTSALTGGGGGGMPGGVPGMPGPGGGGPGGLGGRIGGALLRAGGGISSAATGMLSLDTFNMTRSNNLLGNTQSLQFFNESFGGLGSANRQNMQQRLVLEAMNSGTGAGLQRAGMGMQILGGLSLVAAAGAAFIPGAQPASPFLAKFGLGALGAGGGAQVFGSMLEQNNVQMARARGFDTSSPEYQAALREDQRLQTANRFSATAGAFTVSSFFAGRARFPGGEGAEAIYRAAADNRTAARAKIVAEVGQNTMIPMEQAALAHLGNVTTSPFAFRRFTFQDGDRTGLATGGFIRGRVRNGLFGGDLQENMTDFTGLMGSALGISNITAQNELQNIVAGQGFRGVMGDIMNGYSAIANPNLNHSAKFRRLKELGVDEAFVRPHRTQAFRFESDVAAQAGPMAPGDMPTGLAGRRFPTGEIRIASGERGRLAHGGVRIFRNVDGNIDQMVAAFTGGFAGGIDPAGDRFTHNGQNRHMRLSDIIAFRQAGFTDAEIGMAGQAGLGGSGASQFFSAADLLGEANFMGLRGGAAQRFIQSRIGFVSGLTQRGINLQAITSAPSGFTAARPATFQLRDSIIRGGRNLQEFVQPGFFDDGGLGRNMAGSGAQLLGEINTIINQGRAQGLQSFMGANFGARAAELMSPSTTVAGKIRALGGGFASDILMSSLLAENGGSIHQAFRAAERMGPLSALRRLRAVGGEDRNFLMDAMTDLGFSSDTARMAIDSPMELQRLMQLRQKAAPGLMQSTASGIQAEVETQRAQNFDPVKFRTLKLTEQLKENSEINKLTLKQIYSLLKIAYKAQKRKRKQPVVEEPEVNIDEMTPQELDDADIDI